LGSQQDVVVPEAKHPEALRFQPSVPLLIGFGSKVLAAICLDDQARAKMHEIDNVLTDGLLSAKLLPIHSMVTQKVPKQGFRIGHAATQLPGEFVLLHVYPPHPNPSPARGEGSKANRVLASDLQNPGFQQPYGWSSRIPIDSLHPAAHPRATRRANVHADIPASESPI